MRLEADDRRLARLRLLVARAVRPPEDDPPRGASPAELAALADRLRQPLPPALRTWLSICNGAAIGPGGVFGQRSDRRHADIARFLDLYPEWRGLGWIPVAGDGCGNYYVLTADGTVGFVETMSNPAKIARQAGPDLLSFMTDLLAADQSPDNLVTNPAHAITQHARYLTISASENEQSPDEQTEQLLPLWAPCNSGAVERTTHA